MNGPADERAKARDLIGRALIPEGGQGGVAGALDQLETRLRQPYTRALTAEDFNDIRAYLTARMDVVYQLLEPRPPDRIWSEHNIEFSGFKQEPA